MVDHLYSTDAKAPWLLRQLQAPAQKEESWDLFRVITPTPFWPGNEQLADTLLARVYMSKLHAAASPDRVTKRP